MNSRRDIFTSMIKKIFGSSNVRFTCYGDYIATDGNQVSEAKYTFKTCLKFIDIFDSAYCKKFTIIKSSFSKAENQKIIGYDTIIHNTIQYFSDLGCAVDETHINQLHPETIGRFFCSAITEILLPFIFDGTDSDEDAELDFEHVKSELNFYFSGFDLGYIVHKHAKAKDIETVFDSEYVRINDNKYAVPIDRSRVESDIYIHFPINYISIGIKTNESDRYTFERIISKYQKYPFNDNEPFIGPFIGQAEEYAANSIKHSEDSCFPLSSVLIPIQYFIPRYFYYVTCINEYVINNYNASRSDLNRIDHSELDKILIKRATIDFRQEHREDISEYYRHVIRYIEDMIKRISTADYCPIIRRDTDVEVCQKFAKNFNIDYEKIIEYIEEDDSIQTVYRLIEDEVLKFVRNIARYNNSFSPLKLADELKEFLPYDIKGHYLNICDYIESKTLSEAISLCDKILLEEKDRNNACESPKQGPNVSGNICDNLIYVQRKLAPKNKYNEIYQTLKDYCDALKSVIDS